MIFWFFGFLGGMNGWMERGKRFVKGGIYWYIATIKVVTTESQVVRGRNSNEAR